MTTKKNQVGISNRRSRASIACYRCHHKKIRCDATKPECTRCKSTGIVCAYPPSRRSRSTQPTNISPFINDISQLETRIKRIESDLEEQHRMVKTMLESESGLLFNDSDNNNTMPSKKATSKMHEEVTCSSEMQTADCDIVQPHCIIYDQAMLPGWNTFQQDASMISNPKNRSNVLLNHTLDDVSPVATRSSSLGSQSDFDFTLQSSYSTTSTSTSYFTFNDQIFDYEMPIQSDASFFT